MSAPPSVTVFAPRTVLSHTAMLLSPGTTPPVQEAGSLSGRVLSAFTISCASDRAANQPEQSATTHTKNLLFMTDSFF